MTKLHHGVIRNAIIVMTSVVIGATALYGCGGESPTATAVPPPTATAPPPAPTNTTAAAAAPTAATGSSGSSGANQPNDPAAINIMQQSARAMQGLKSAHLSMQIEGGAAAAAGTAEGDIDLPDKMRISMNTPQGTSEEVIIGSKMYVKIPGSDAYMSIPSSPAILSLAATLKNMNAYTQYAQGASIVGGEQVAGAATQHVKYYYDPDKVNAAFFASQGLPTPVPTGAGTLATGEMWIDRGSYYVRQYKYTVPSATDQTQMQTVTVMLSKFNEPVSPAIEEPTNVQQLPGLPTLTP